MKRRETISAVLVIMMTVLASCTEPRSSGPVVARIDGEGISQSEYRSEYASYLLQTGLRDEASRRRAFLNQLIGKKLLVLEAGDSGLRNSDAYRYHERTSTEKLLIDLYIQRTFLDTMAVSERQLEEMFVRVNTQIRARHLFARSRDEADRLYDRLQAGESFDSLAREIFDDPGLASSGGDLGYFSFDEMDPAFENAAFRLSDSQISAPVRTSEGFSIIKVEGRRVKPILTRAEFATKRDRLETYVRYRQELDLRRTLLSETLAEASPEIDDSVIDEVLDVVFGRNLTGGEGRQSRLMEKKMLTFNMSGTQITWLVRDFRDAASLASSEQRLAVQSQEDLTAFLDGLIVRTVLAGRARERHLDQDPTFRRALDKEMNSWMYETAYEDRVESMEVTDDTLRSYFEQFKSEFTTPERVAVREILVASKQDAERAMDLLRTEDFSKVASVVSIRPGASASGGNLGPLTRAELGALASRVFDVAAGTVLGPIELDEHFVILQVGQRKEPGIARFPEVRDRIEDLVRQLRKKEMFRLHVAALRERYSVESFTESVDQITLTSHVSS